MNGHNASIHDAGIDERDPLTIPNSELRFMRGDFESLVTAGILQGTCQEAADFFSGWLASENQHCPPSPDPLRLIVLPGFGKDDR